MKKNLLSLLTFLLFAAGGFANTPFQPITLDLQENLPKALTTEEFDVQGICKGSAVVVDFLGNIHVIQMGKPDEVIITGSASDCQKLFLGFIEELSYSFRVVVSESDYEAL